MNFIKLIINVLLLHTYYFILITSKTAILTQVILGSRFRPLYFLNAHFFVD